MTDDQEKAYLPITITVCGPSNVECNCQCPDGPCDHVWDGLEESGESEGAFFSTSTCSRCGMTAIDHSMWVAP